MSIDPLSIHLPAPHIQKPLLPHALSGQTMGTRYGVHFFAPADIDNTHIHAALQLAVDHVDSQMSPWKATSDLMRFNNGTEGEWIAICQETLAVIQAGLRIEDMSDGAFNIALGRAVNAWGFGAEAAKNTRQLPNELSVKRPTKDLLTLDIDTGRLRKEGVATLDLCGIAKGFGVDQLAIVLGDFGIENYLTSIDGELRMSGEKPDGGAWQVAIEHPNPASREVFCTLNTSDIALATSGDYRHFKQHLGRNISHTIDGRTGMPVENTLTSVTVACETCMEADAWATALLAMGKDRALQCARTQNLDSLLIERNAEKLVLHTTGDFENLDLDVLSHPI